MNYKILLGLLALSAFMAFTATVDGARILAVFPFPSRSHFMMIRALTRELIERGHQLTAITAFTLEPKKLGKNYTEVLIEPVYDYWNDVKEDAGAETIFDMTTMDIPGFLQMLQVSGITTTEHALKQPKVQAIINAKKTDDVYDLLLVEQFYQEPFLALAYIYKIPIVAISTLGYENHMSQMVGLITPWSYVPHGFLPVTERMNFWERLQNSYYSLYEDIHREYKYFPRMDKITQKYFGHLPSSNVQSKDMPDEFLRVFLNVFRTMKQRILWKFENDSLPNLPTNVMVQKWMPQSDILSHPNVRVFITHGGLLGSQEGIYNGVPMLGMPFYCDQHLNLKKAGLYGYAISLHFQSVTEDLLKNAFAELLENPSYRNNIKRISAIFRDRPQSARDTALYWIEYVVRHKGAPHLRAAGMELSWYQFYLLDIAAFVIGVFALSVLALVFLARFIWCRLQSRTKKSTKGTKAKNYKKE